MRKQKKNRFYYSKKQSDIENDMWGFPTRFTFVKTPDGWRIYSEWCSTKGAKCNWEDAKLVYETDDEPEIIIHDGIPEFINELQEENDKLKSQLAERDIETTVGEFWHSAYKGKQLDYDRVYAELRKSYDENEKLMKELHYKNCECEKWKADYQNCSRLEKLMTKEHQYCLDNWRVSEQNKISFCIEKLTEVRSFISDATEIKEPDYTKVCNYIDNQIKQLKEGK